MGYTLECQQTVSSVDHFSPWAIFGMCQFAATRMDWSSSTFRRFFFKYIFQDSYIFFLENPLLGIPNPGCDFMLNQHVSVFCWSKTWILRRSFLHEPRGTFLQPMTIRKVGDCGFKVTRYYTQIAWNSMIGCVFCCTRILLAECTIV